MDVKEALQREKFTSLGRYHVRQRIGRGGMGDVWLCNDPRLKRQVAIKTLSAHRQLNDDFIRRFEREAESAAALNHPHIVAVHDFGQHSLLNGSVIPYIVMPYIKGGSLADRLTLCEQQGTRLPAHAAFTLLEQAAEAVDYAHSKQLIHCDIKPANMLLRDDDWLLITDFGIAHLLTDTPSFGKPHTAAGTPEYMPPEQVQGHAGITSDIYSLAIVVFQIFTGQLPFQGETAIATTMQQLTQPPPSPRQLNPALSPTFEHILMQGLNKDPAQRPALACDLIAQLKLAYTDDTYQAASLHTLNAIQELAIHDPTLENTNETTSLQTKPATVHWSRRQLLFAGGTAAALVSGSLAGGWAWWTITRNNPRSIPASAPLSAQPTSTGPNKPALILTGHINPASQIAWTHDGSKLISLDTVQGQLLTWNITQLNKQPVQSPLYTALRDFTVDGTGNPYFSIAPDDTFLALAQGTFKTTITLYTPQLTDMTGHDTPITISDNTVTTTGVLCLPDHILLLAQSVTDTNTLGQYRLQLLQIDHTPPLSIESTATHTLTHKGLPGADITLVAGPITSQKVLCSVSGEASTQATEIQFTSSTDIQMQVKPLYVPFPESDNASAIGSGLTAGDGSYLVALGNKDVIGSPVRFQDRQTGATHTLSWPDNLASNVSATTMVCNPKSLTPAVAVGTSSGSIYLWDLHDGSTPVRQLDTSAIQANVQSLAWSTDGQWLAASFADENCTILIWKL